MARKPADWGERRGPPVSDDTVRGRRMAVVAMVALVLGLLAPLAACNMMAAAREGEEVYGEAQVERATRLLTFVSGRLRAGERTLMTASGVFRSPPETGAVSI